MAVVLPHPAVSGLPAERLRDGTLLSNECRAYIEQYQASRSSYRSKRCVLEAFTEFLSDVTGKRRESLLFSDITRPRIERYRNEMLEDYSTNTVALHVNQLKHFVAFVTDSHATTNFAVHVRAPEAEDSGIRGLSESEYESLRRYIGELQPRYSYPVDLLLSTGMRRDEAVSVTLGQISDDWLFIRDVHGKGLRRRDIPISPALRQATMRYLAWRQWAPTRPEYPLLVTKYRVEEDCPESYRMTDSTLYRQVRHILGSAGAHESVRHPHALRRTFALQFLRQYAAVQGEALGRAEALVLLTKYLGHKDIRVTMRYLKHSREQLWRALSSVHI